MGGKRRHWLVVFALSSVLLSAAPAPAEPPPGTFALTLGGPIAAGPGVATSYSGRLTLAGAPMPGQTVELLVNGALAASATTGIDGTYSAVVIFGSFGPTTVQAVAYRQTALETRSPLLNVTVGFVLTVLRAGTGAGTVNSSPPGINCGGSCQAYYAPGTLVNLDAFAASGSALSSWAGACSGSGPCSVLMDGDKSVTATFADILPPTAPVFIGTSPVSPANNNNPQILGAAEAGSTVKLYTDGACAGAVAGTRAASGTGSFGIPVSVANDTTTTFHATAVDASGNISDCSAGISYVEDSTGPALPVITGTSPVSPSSSNDPVILGTAETGSVVKLYTNATCSGTPAASGSAAGGAFSIPVTVASDATTVFHAQATDAAANISGCSAGITYVEDSSAPAIPTLTGTGPSSPSSSNNPEILGTAETGSTVRLYTNATCTSSVAGTGAVAGGSFSITVSVADDSMTTFFASATDAAANTSGCSTGITYVEDSTSPAAPSLTSTGPVSPANDNSPQILGIAETGSTVRLYTNETCTSTVAGTGTAAGGSFSIAVSVADNSTTTFFAKATDTAANTSGCSGGITYVEDSDSPAAPTLIGTGPASPANNNNPQIFGLAETDSTARLFTDSGCTSAVAGSGVADGGFAITVAVADNTTTTFFATATDAAGNTSPCSTTGVTYVEDSIPPAAPAFTGIAPASPVNFNTPFASGSAEAGSTVALYTDPSCSSTVTGTGSAAEGSFTISVTVADDTTTTFFAKATDPAANASDCSPTSVTYVEDSTPPSFAGLSSVTAISTSVVQLTWSSATDSVTPSASIRYDICVSQTLDLCIDDFFPARFAPPGATSVEIDGLSENTRYFFLVRARDEASNEDPNSVQKSAKTFGTRVFASIDGGNFHTCSLLSDGTARCWGANGLGQLGTGTTSSSSTTPVTVGGLSTLIAISGGASATCGLVSDGTGRCWGNNNSGQLGDGTTTGSSVPVTISGLSTATAISVGSGHACALQSNGTGRCWGTNSSGQLGNGTTTTSSVPVTVSGLSGATAISAGGSHTCGLVSDGTARCWGNGLNGRLGHGAATSSSTPVAVSGLTGAAAIVAAALHSCALLSDGTVRCWGRNASGQLGNGNTTDSSVPVTVTGLAGAIAIAAGSSHTCALLSSGSVRCWGRNFNGQLGDASTTDSSTPVTVTGLTGAIAITAGDNHSCALRSDGTARCWGGNNFGALGNGTSTASTIPVTVLAPTAAVGGTTATAGNAQTCGLLSDGSARCWGRNDFGQLGNGSTTDRTVPVAVLSVSGAVEMAGGREHTCALLSDGTARCWGRNDVGQLGNGSTTDRTVAQTVAISGAIAIAAGNAHTCALRSDGTARCWGYNFYGQLGNGTTTNASTPVTVTGLSGAVAISAGGHHTCALLSDGTARCWGYNVYGQLGNGTTTNSSVPVTVSGLSGAIAIANGAEHTCAVRSDGTARCWGDNRDGELGDATTVRSSVPVTVSGLSAATAVTAGFNHACAIRSDGTARCWGDNSSGQLGNGTVTDSSVPVTVSGILSAIVITAGAAHGCALLTDGTVRCWGINSDGQLGDGSTTPSSTPVAAFFP